MDRRLLALAVCALVLALAPAPAAEAAVVRFVEVDLDVFGLLVTDTAGERNDLVITLSDKSIVVRERGSAPLVAPPECRAVSERAITCNADLGESVRVRAGAGDDRVTVRGDTFHGRAIDGGGGDDRLHIAGGDEDGEVAGGAGDDVLVGSRDDETLYGGAGADVLRGGPGRDTLQGDARRGARGRDVLDGGRGHDTATWAERRSAVVVDLAAGRGGRAGTEDTVRSIESAGGGAGRDVLRGTGGPNDLLGGPGRDVLDGRAGADIIDAGGSTTRVQGGTDARVDTIACGAGDDLVYNLDLPREPLARDCERMGSTDATLLDEPIRAQLVELSGGRVRVEVFCAPEVASCRRRVTLRRRGRVLGRSRLVSPRRRRPFVTVPLTAPLPASGLVDVQVTGFDVGDIEAEDRDTRRRRYAFRYRVAR
jgi:Ca2+-binding RTX toxin-like protein